MTYSAVQLPADYDREAYVRYARRMGLRQEDADDVVQEATLALLEYLERGNTIETSTRALMCTIISNMRNKRWNRRQRTQQVMEDLKNITELAQKGNEEEHTIWSDIVRALESWPLHELSKRKVIYEGVTWLALRYVACFRQMYAAQTDVGTIMDRDELLREIEGYYPYTPDREALRLHVDLGTIQAIWSAYASTLSIASKHYTATSLAAAANSTGGGEVVLDARLWGTWCGRARKKLRALVPERDVPFFERWVDPALMSRHAT